MSGAVLFLLAAGCSGLLTSDEPPVRVYWLDPPRMETLAPADGPQPRLGLAVSAAPGLDTDRLLLRDSNARVRQYEAARWQERLPEIFESAARVVLESTGRYSRVTSGFGDADYELELEIREFLAVSNSGGGAPSVSLSFAGHLQCGEKGRPIAFEAEIPAGSSGLDDIVAAHQRALDRGLTQLAASLAGGCGL